MYGARISLSVGFAAALLNLVIGVAYGAICGYFGGKVDMILMRLVDIIYSVPTLLYVILIMLIFGSNIFSMLLAIGISSWVGMARLVRGQILTLKEQEYALAAYVIGASKKRIMFKHLIVNWTDYCQYDTDGAKCYFHGSIPCICRYWNQHSAGKLGNNGK